MKQLIYKQKQYCWSSHPITHTHTHTHTHSHACTHARTHTQTHTCMHTINGSEKLLLTPKVATKTKQKLMHDFYFIYSATFPPAPFPPNWPVPAPVFQSSSSGGAPVDKSFFLSVLKWVHDLLARPSVSQSVCLSVYLSVHFLLQVCHAARLSAGVREPWK